MTKPVQQATVLTVVCTPNARGAPPLKRLYLPCGAEIPDIVSLQHNFHPGEARTVTLELYATLEPSDKPPTKGVEPAPQKSAQLQVAELVQRIYNETGVQITNIDVEWQSWASVGGGNAALVESVQIQSESVANWVKKA